MTPPTGNIKTTKQPVVSRAFLMQISLALAPMLLAILSARLHANHVFESINWHKQYNHHLQVEKWNFDLPRWWFPINQEHGALILRASLFHPSSEVVSIYRLSPDAWAIQNPEDWQQLVEHELSGPSVKSPVLQLQGKPGVCIVHSGAKSSSGQCMFREDGLVVEFRNVDNPRMKEVTAIVG